MSSGCILPPETFALRSGEKIHFHDTMPLYEAGDFEVIACMLRTVDLPPGPIRDDDPEVKATNCAIVTSIWSDTGWMWCHCSLTTKLLIGDILEAKEAERDRWYFIRVSR